MSEDTNSSEQQVTYPTSLISSSSSLIKVTEDYNFDTAGSPLYLNGSLYFTNNNFDRPEKSMTLRKSSSGEIDTLAIDNGVTTTLQASGNGNIYACEMLGHQVVELNADGEVIQLIASEYNSSRIDGPNDLVVDNNGGVYFSDSQFIAGGQKMQETPGVYYVSSEGKISRVIEDVEFPNGLGLSPDNTTLYVANTVGSHLLAYDVSSDGSLTNKRNFSRFKVPEEVEESGADGMVVDKKGNIYVATTRGLGVQIFSSEGEYLGNIPVPSATNNVTFGGVDNRTLYISAQDGIYSISTKTEGLGS